MNKGLKNIGSKPKITSIKLSSVVNALKLAVCRLCMDIWLAALGAASICLLEQYFRLLMVITSLNYMRFSMQIMKLTVIVPH